MYTTNPWYVNSTVPAPQTLIRGQTINYSPRVARDGQVLLSVTVLDPQTGNTETLAQSGVTGSVRCPTGGDSFGSLAKAVNGVVTVRGVNAGTGITCTVTATTACTPGPSRTSR